MKSKTIFTGTLRAVSTNTLLITVPMASVKELKLKANEIVKVTVEKIEEEKEGE